MPRSPRYTVRAYVDITPATKKQLHRLAAYHETSVPQLIRSAIAAAHGLPTDEDRQPGLLDKARPGRKKAQGGR